MRLACGHVSPWVEWAACGRALPGEQESADRAVVARRPDGCLIAVIDGLGHGADAVVAAEKAAEAVEAHATAASVEAVLEALHAALAGTRGAVASVGLLDAVGGRLAWAGVGDVEGVLHPRDAGRKRESLFLMPGVIGDRLPRLRPQSVAVAPGDTIVFATDGIRRAFLDEAPRLDPPDAFAERILDSHGRKTDDALALVVRYLGPA